MSVKLVCFLFHGVFTCVAEHTFLGTPIGWEKWIINNRCYILYMETKTIIVNSVNVEAYRKVKAEAAIKGLTIGEMINVILDKYFSGQ